MVLQRKVIFDISLPHELIHASFNTSALNPTCVTTQYIYLSFFLHPFVYLSAFYCHENTDKWKGKNESFYEFWKAPQNLFLDFYHISYYVSLTVGQQISAEHYKCNIFKHQQNMSSHAFPIISSLYDATNVN